MKKSVKQYNTKKALIYSLIALGIFLFLIWEGFSFLPEQVDYIEAIIIFVFQVTLLILIIKSPIKKIARIKGAIAVLLFILIRAAFLISSTSSSSSNTEIYWFFALVIIYLGAAVLVLDALKEVLE